MIPSRSLWQQYLPLALSFELMMAEAPTLQAAVGRLPEPEANLAAWGLVMGLALMIESPVIMLLATAIALVRDRPSFVALRKFTLLLALWCTALTGMVAFTPLFGFVTGNVMNQPPEVASLGQFPLGVMLFWSGLIAWRRFYQGALVRFGAARWMTAGTVLRLASIFVVAMALSGPNHSWPTGAGAAAIAIMAGVFIEAVATTLFAIPVLKRDLPARDPDAVPLSQVSIGKFHAPLALNSLLSLLAQPLTAAALARLPNAHATLAAWPVVFGILLITRGWCFAVQEVTVAQVRRGEETSGLWRFALLIGSVTSLALLGLALSPAMDAYFRALGTPENLRELVRSGALYCAPTPLLTALGSYFRGVRVASGATVDAMVAMALGLATQLLALGAGVYFTFDGIAAGAASLTLSLLVETGYLAFRDRVAGRRTLPARSA